MVGKFKSLWRRLTRRRPAKPTPRPRPTPPPLLTALPLPCYGVTQTQATGEAFALAACDCGCKSIVLFSTAKLAAAQLAAMDEQADIIPLNTWPDLRAYLVRAARQHKARRVELDPTCDSAAGRGCIARLLAAGDRKGA